MTLQTHAQRYGLADSARDALEASRAESRADKIQAHRRFLDLTHDDAEAALIELVGEHDAAQMALVPSERGWCTEIADLPCFYDTDDELTQQWKAGWRASPRTCPACKRDIAGPFLHTLEALGEALDHAGAWPHDCQTPARFHVSGWKQPKELAEWLNELATRFPGVEIVTTTAVSDSTRLCVVVRVPSSTANPNGYGF